MNDLRITPIQTDIIWENKEANPKQTTNNTPKAKRDNRYCYFSGNVHYRIFNEQSKSC